MCKKQVGQSTEFNALKSFNDLLAGKITIEEYRNSDSQAVTEPIYQKYKCLLKSK